MRETEGEIMGGEVSICPECGDRNSQRRGEGNLRHCVPCGKNYAHGGTDRKSKEDVVEELGLKEELLPLGWRRVLFVMANRLIGHKLAHGNAHNAMLYASGAQSAVAPEAASQKFIELYIERHNELTKKTDESLSPDSMVRLAEQEVSKAASEVINAALHPGADKHVPGVPNIFGPDGKPLPTN